MNKCGMLYHKIHDRVINGETFKTCLQELKAICNVNGIDTPVFILDNARIHHYSGLAETICHLGLELVSLPPYSPFLNPIENCFSVWKNFVVRGAATSEPELKNLIESRFNEVSSQSSDAFYMKMLRYVNRSAEGEIILE
ncbi:hypothetical protein HERIO_1574 [Hepatospora eriocheir]|uniref:Tc1-like transposase DDE domain-containing protein n=1 Tax=Hepatospora eriocheir TaxID=1081669 RepID=A0A1X0Q9P1_9MICR|nr:hypothetical protein HERIO_1574 [Hepatospora eriocheir]